MRWITRREWLSKSLQAAGAAAFSPTLLSCSRARPPRESSTLTVLYPEELETQENFMVFAPLFVASDGSQWEPRLAESWHYAADTRTWTVRLRDGVRWHDGAPVTAEDMKFTLDLKQHPDVEWVTPGNYTVEVLDRLTFTLTRHRRGTVEIAPIGPVTVCWPKHLLEGLDPKQFWSWEFWSHPVGCGPYRHVRTVPHAMMEFEANPDYFRGRPNIRRVILKFGGTSIVPELLSGNVDVVVGTKSADTLVLSRDPRFRAYQVAWPSSQALWWNLRNELFSDPGVRRALTHAINRRELLQVLNMSDDIHLKDYIATEQQASRRGFPAAIPYHPQLAKQLLDEAGWSLPPRKKLRERNGKPFRFKTLVAKWADNFDAAVYVQDQLKRVGVGMDIIPISDSSLVTSRMKAGEFDAALTIIAGNVNTLLPAVGYNNPRFFSLMKNGEIPDTPDRMEEFERLIRDLNSTFQADVPATLLYPYTWTTIAISRLRGMEKIHHRWNLTQCMEDLTLAEGVA